MRLKGFLLLLAISPILLAMGSLSETPADKIPKPAKKFLVTYVDQLDVITECTDASIEGNTYIEGRRGGGLLAIDFEKIRNIVFRMNNNDLIGDVQLKDGSQASVILNKSKRAYGRTRQGVFQIKLSDLKKMTISGIAPNGPQGIIKE